MWRFGDNRLVNAIATPVSYLEGGRDANASAISRLLDDPGSGQVPGVLITLMLRSRIFLRSVLRFSPKRSAARI